MIKKLLLLTISLSSLISFAQISNNNLPISSIQKVSGKVPVLELLKPSSQQINSIVSPKENNGTTYAYAISVEADIDTENSGKWQTLSDGSKIWRLSIKIDGAKALGLYYDAFRLPSDGELFIYNHDKSQVIGGFTNLNNHESGVFANELIIGEFLTLEYHQKSSGTPIIHINEIAYCFRGVDNLYEQRDFGDSDNCQVNPECSEGDNWRDIIRSACRISVKTGNTYGWCSGAMINNTAQDCKPYILTADHCGYGQNQNAYASTQDLNQWVFYFNFESGQCENPQSSPGTNASMVGASLLAHSNENGSINNTSDFFLVELNNVIPNEYGAYAAGWDRTNTASSSGVSIHHPSGDIKKISTYTQNLTTSGWNGNGSTHWRVRWSATENGHGVTEGGSSGSPIFNSNGQIIGDLSGGSSFCTFTNGRDLYGKLSYSWSPNGASNNEMLKPWLDPTNSGVTTLDGKACGKTIFSNFYGAYENVVTGGNNQYYYSGTNNASEYLWTFYGGTPISSTEASPTVNYPNPGTYTVKLKVTDINGDTDTETKSNYILVNDFGGSSNIDENHNIEFNVYPNPSNGILYLSQNPNSISTLLVTNILGEKLKEISFTTETTRIDLTDLENGVYLVTIKNQKGYKTEKITISK